MSNLLEIKSLSAGYGSETVLENVNLGVGENDFIGVIGPNGGGKTTLLRVILGLVKPFNGTMLFKGSPLKSFQIGYLPQISEGDNTFPVTVKDVILSGLMINKKITGENDRQG